jgi:Protein of unknown function (DUF3467)
MKKMEEELGDKGPVDIKEEESITISRLPVKKAQDFIRLYASIFSISSTPLDLSLQVGQPIVDDRVDAHVEQRATITMSWQAAKTLAAIVDLNVKNYEKQFGEIQLGILQPPSA